MCVAPSLSRSWVYRFSWHGRRPEMGLGRFPDVSLAEARALRDEAGRALRSGRNPIEERRTAKLATSARQTFGAIADRLFESKVRELRSKRSLDQWRASLVEAVAGLRARPVDEIDTEAVLALIRPLWLERPKNADRLRGRIEAVLDAARAGGHRTGENPARWRGHLEHLLPRPPKLVRGHHAAMSYDELPAFLKRLRGVDTVSARALEFAILTAGRSGEVYGARWPEIDLGGRVWIIPATRMKAAREHRVPLSDRALSVLEELAEALAPGHGDSARLGARPRRWRQLRLRWPKRRNCAFDHGPPDDAAPHESWRDHGPRPSLKLQRLGERSQLVQCGAPRDGPRAHDPEQGRACLPSRRRTGKAQAIDGGLCRTL